MQFLFAQKCAGHMMLPLLSQISDIIENSEVDTFSWATFNAIPIDKHQEDIRYMFWMALFNECPLKLFHGKRSVSNHEVYLSGATIYVILTLLQHLLGLVADEITTSTADSAEQMNHTSWLKAMASFHQLCANVHSVLYAQKRSINTTTETAQLLVDAADWKNRLPLYFRDLDLPSPGYLRNSGDVRRAGVRLTCSYYELCVTIHCASVSVETSATALTESHVNALARLFEWSSALTTRDFVSDS